MAEVIPFPAPTYAFFNHAIDERTHYCTGCGRFLKDLQDQTKWIGNKVTPPCAINVTAISHLVRSGN